MSNLFDDSPPKPPIIPPSHALPPSVLIDEVLAPERKHEVVRLVDVEASVQAPTDLPGAAAGVTTVLPSSFARKFQLSVLRKSGNKWGPDTVFITNSAELLDLSAQIDSGKLRTPVGRSLAMQVVIALAEHAGFLAKE